MRLKFAKELGFYNPMAYTDTIRDGMDTIINFKPAYRGATTPSDDILDKLKDKDRFEVTFEVVKSLTYETEITDAEADKLLGKRDVMAGEKRKRRISKRQAIRIMLLLVTEKVYQRIPSEVSEQIELGNTLNLYNITFYLDGNF